MGGQEIIPVRAGDDASDLEENFLEWTKEVVTYLDKQLRPQSGLEADTTTATLVNGLGSHGGTGASTSSHNHADVELPVKVDDIIGEDTEALQEEDLINMKYLEGDDPMYDTDDEEGEREEGEGGNSSARDISDLEDLGNEIKDIYSSKQLLNGNADERSSLSVPQVPRDMVTNLQRKSLTKEGYRIIGTHSAVKLCRWTKNQLRGRGGCYKHTFYGITSYQCMEATPSLACANKCVFCWRHHKNPVGTSWRWKTDEPEYIVEEAIKEHKKMINQMRGVPGVQPSRLLEGFNVQHCALSLVGEPIMYPRINDMLRQLHMRHISTFLVTNAQFPECIQSLDPVTQLYVSVDAAKKESLKAIDRPLFKDFWERFNASLQNLAEKKQRTVYRLTLVKDWNMEEVEAYAQLIHKWKPDLIEIKAVTYCGKSDASSLTMKNVPWHVEVCNYAESILSKLDEIRANESVAQSSLGEGEDMGHRDESPKPEVEDDRGPGVVYGIATQHEHSCCILMAREDKYKVDGVWHTWIDYPRFHELMKRYYDSQGRETFTSVDYIAVTPEWALYQSAEKGFDPQEARWRRNKSGALVENVYKPSGSGCG